MNIVVGYVSRPEGEAALTRAIEEAGLHEARLVVLHSMRGRHWSDPEEILEYEETLEAVEQRLVESAVDHTVRQYVRGRSVAEDVVSTAEEERAQLIVIGLRRRSPVGKLVLGSHAQEILLNAPCAVLSVPADAGPA